MKKWYKLIIVGVLILIVIGIFKDKPGEDLIGTANISDELGKLPQDEVGEETIVDFSRCLPEDSFKVDYGLGSNQLKILGPQEEHCQVEATYEIEGGYYVNECKVPLSLGKIAFKGHDFDSITPFCTLKTSGGGLLELE